MQKNQHQIKCFDQSLLSSSRPSSSKFAYCPLVRMFYSRELNHKISRLHESCLCVVYHDTTSSFKELRQKHNSVSIHRSWP